VKSGEKEDKRDTNWRERIEPLLLAGHTCAAIARQFGVSRQWIHQLAVRYGLREMRPRYSSVAPLPRRPATGRIPRRPPRGVYHNWTLDELTIVLDGYYRWHLGEGESLSRVARRYEQWMYIDRESIYRNLYAFRVLDNQSKGREKGYRYSQLTAQAHAIWDCYQLDPAAFAARAQALLAQLHPNGLPSFVETPQHRWNWDEQILVLDEYFRVRFEPKGARKRSGAALAELIDTTESAVFARFKVYQGFDPQMRARGIRGLSKHSALELAVWEWYAEHGPEALAAAAAAIRRRAQRESADPQ
jgi:hypothetical protein